MKLTRAGLLCNFIGSLCLAYSSQFTTQFGFGASGEMTACGWWLNLVGWLLFVGGFPLQLAATAERRSQRP